MGLTSAANRDFCVATGCYDQVLSYDEIAQVEGSAIAFVDMAGHGGVRRDVHTLLGARLGTGSEAEPVPQPLKLGRPDPLISFRQFDGTLLPE